MNIIFYVKVQRSNTCIQYRLDYVKNVEIVKDSDVKFDDYQLNSFEKKLNNMTYMYGEGKIEVIELEFTPSVYSNMIDKLVKIFIQKNK